MLKHTFLNALFNGLAQAISLAVIFTLASTLDAELFGSLNIQLSSATVLSIIFTMQFERIYVRIKSHALAKYISFHLRSLIIVSLSLAFVSALFEQGLSTSVLAFGMGFSQISLYAAARQGKFRRIWIMKGIQGVSLLIFSSIIYLLEQERLFWLAFFISYSTSGLIVFDAKVRKTFLNTSWRNDYRRLKYSVTVAALSLGSLLTGSIARELPVLLAGMLGQNATAGAVGLVMRTVGAPIGLLARSASAVVASYVASKKFGVASIKSLLVVPLMGLIYIVALLYVSPYFPLTEKYEEFTFFLISFAPFFLVKSFTGMLGPAIVYYRLQHIDLCFNLATITSMLLVASLISVDLLDFNVVPISISTLSTLFSLLLTHRLIMNFSKSG